MADTNKLLGHTLNDRYRVEELIGKGGSGQVYKARDLTTDTQVALKIIRGVQADDPESVIRFEKEVAVSARLVNPHTVRVTEFGKTKEGYLFIAMDHLQGRSLATVIDEEAPLSPRRSASIVIQTLDALAEAHRAGIVHRDLKPDNIYIVKDESDKDLVKVLDFGIAKFLLDDTVGDTLTRDGFVFGTPLYISPEQALGWQVGPASDLYSLGVVMFEMLAGYPPFTAETPIGLGMKHIYEPPPLDRLKVNDEAFVGIKKILEALLEKRPERRPATAEKVLAMFQSLGDLVDIPFEVKAHPQPESVSPSSPAAVTVKARPVDTQEQAVQELLEPEPEPEPEPESVPVATTKKKKKSRKKKKKEAVSAKVEAPVQEASVAEDTEPELEPALEPAPEPAAAPEPEPAAVSEVRSSQPEAVDGPGETLSYEMGEDDLPPEEEDERVSVQEPFVPRGSSEPEDEFAMPGGLAFEEPDDADLYEAAELETIMARERRRDTGSDSVPPLAWLVIALGLGLALFVLYALNS